MASPPRWVASYKAVYTFKCAASALATCSLALLSNYVFTRGTDFAKAFAVYFMFDSTFDLGMDLTFRPPRKSKERMGANAKPHIGKNGKKE